MLCDVQALGLIAVELVALDHPGPMTRARNMYETQRAWDGAMLARPPGEKAVLRHAFADAHIHVAFAETAGLRDRAAALYALQTYLLSNTGRRGPITPPEIGHPEGFRSAHIHRGTTTHGPQILTGASGWWSPPQVEPLIKHLRTPYRVAGRLDLFAYSEHDDPDGSVSSLASIEAAVTENLPGSLFSAVHLFYVAHQAHIRSWEKQSPLHAEGPECDP